MKPILFLALAAACLSNPTGKNAPQGKYEPTWESLDRRPIPAWFNEAKFGIFIHWGVYSVPAWRPLSEKKYASYAEWYYARVIGDLVNGGDAFHKRVYGETFTYRDFAPRFKAELFDPDFWAETFRRAGARYVVLTSKHHDGFCLWPTKSPYKKNWNSADVGPRRDLVGALAEAVRKKGMKMGLYYSLIEFESSPTKRQPSGYWLDKKIIDRYAIPRDQYVDRHILPQLKELVLHYRPALIFSDGGEWDETAEFWKTREFLSWLYNEAPNRDEVLVNDRWCLGMPGKHGDYFSSEYRDAALAVSHPWEESRGVGGSYGFNRAENLADYRTSQELVHELIDIVSRGGNFLLNVGPTADGRIPVIQQQRLADIGDWLRVNGDAIYGSTSVNAGAWMGPEYVRFTRRGPELFAICTKWPENPFVLKEKAAGPVISVRMLGLGQKIRWERRGSEITIHPPTVTPATVPCSHAWVFAVRTGTAKATIEK
jgi:alpha-L-fucosidase